MLAAALIALALAAPPVTRDVLPVFVEPVTSHGSEAGADFQYSWGGSKIGALPHLSVFDRRRRASDVLQGPALHFAHDSGGDAARSRLLLNAGGSSIYAWPARDGKQLCVERLPLGGGSCVHWFMHGAYPQVQPRDAVWGIVDDDAVRVDVTVGLGVLHATLGDNAFFLALPHGTVIPSRIVVHERDGARHVYVVKRLGPA